MQFNLRNTDKGPPSDDSLAQLARDAETLEEERKTRLEGFLQRLEVLDTKVARRVLETFGDRAKAAYWLGKALRQFGDLSSYEMLAQGKRLEVLEALARIDNGFFA